MSTRIIRWLFWPTAVLLVIGTTFLVWKYAQPKRPYQPANATPNNKDNEPNPGELSEDPEPTVPTPVNVVKPRTGAMERVTTQPCTVEADEVSLHSQVSGLLKSLGTEKQVIDIGSVVKRNDLLATIDVPEIEKQVERNVAGVELATARVAQMKAKVVIAKADVESAKAQIVYAEAFARSAKAWVVFRTMKLERFEILAKKNSIEGALVDEAKEQYEAAKESENASKAAIVTSKAKKASEDAKILLADADVLEAQAQVKVAKAELERSKVRLDFAKITAPFDGIITQRPIYQGAFIRSATDGSSPQSVLTIQRTDVMRVVVQIPDRDARYADPGDTAIVEIDAFPGEKLAAKVSRIGKYEDRRTRLMPVEIDLENKDGLIRQGMFGKVTIILDPALKQISIPSACLVGNSVNGAGTVFVLIDGKLVRRSIRIGMDNHKRVEVLSGLKTTDEVVFHPPTSLTEASEVLATLVDETKLD
jgi:HlyD family secretion protein